MPVKGTWIEQVDKRTRTGKKHVDSFDPRYFAVDVNCGGSIHYEDNGWKEIDNEFEPAVAPWDWQMLKAGYHIRVKEDFTAGQIIEFEKQGETAQFQPMALEWTNDLDQIQQISMPQNVSPIITNPEVDLLPAVGMPSHQGTIRWEDAYGQGIDFEWHCQSTRLAKRLEIENLNKLPIPQQYIINGGNPVLRLNLIFDPPSKQNVDIVVDGQVWNQSSKKQSFNLIEFRKDGEVLWGFMPLRYWGSGTDPETNQGQSVATLEKRGNKLYISIRVPYDWLQSAIYPVFIDTDIDIRVTASTDDCSVVNLNNIQLTTSSQYVNNKTMAGCGQRFLGVTIPDGVTIGVARLDYIASFSTSATSLDTRVYGEDTSTPATYSTYTDYKARALTGAFTQWNNIEAWTAESPYSSPSIVGVVEEMMASYSYASGLAMAFQWNSDNDETGDKRYAHSWDSDPNKASLLHIEYTVGNGNITVTPITLALNDTQFIPILKEVTTPTTLSLSDTQYIPVLKEVLTPTTLSLSDTQYAPILQEVTTPTTISLNDTEYIPILQEVTTPTTLVLSDTEYIPVLGTGVIPTTLALSSTEYIPILKEVLTPTTLSLSDTQYIPIILIGADVIVTPTTLALSDTQFIPVLKEMLTPTTLSITLNTYIVLMKIAQVITHRNLLGFTGRKLSQHDEDAGYPYIYPITYDDEVDVRDLKTFAGRDLK